MAEDNLDPNKGNQDPNKVTDWHETLPEEIKADPSLKSFKTIGDLAKSWVGAQQFLGREKLPVPKDENDKEGYDLIFKKLGFPEKDTDYQFPTDLQIPKELPIDEGMVLDFRKVAHENRLLPSQVQNLYRWYMKSTVDAYNKFGEGLQLSTKESETNLRKKWGAAYQQNKTLALKVFQNFISDEMWEAFEQRSPEHPKGRGLGNDPVLIELFANIGKVLSEDQLQGKSKQLEMTPDEAKAEIKKMEGDTQGPLYNEAHPQHKEYVEKRERLYKMITVGS